MDVWDSLDTLANWQHEPKQVVTSVIEELYALYDATYEQSTLILGAVEQFQQQLAQAPPHRQGTEWHRYCQALLKRHRANVEAPSLRQREKLMQEERKQAKRREVEYPAALLRGADEADQKRLKMLFKTFTSGMEGAEEGRTVGFVRGLLEALYQAYPVNYNHRGQLSYSQIGKAFSSICIRFEKRLSLPAKRLMLDGQITPQEVALNKHELYHPQDVARSGGERQPGDLLELSSKLEQEKPEGLGERCRFCRQEEAYCMEQRQTRAADEPMTRFMKCFGCRKTWRD